MPCHAMPCHVKIFTNHSEIDSILVSEDFLYDTPCGIISISYTHTTPQAPPPSPEHIDVPFSGSITDIHSDLNPSKLKTFV